MKKQLYSKYQGFTLIEVIVGTSATIIILAAIVGLQYIIGQNQTLLFNNSTSVELTNSNVSLLVREIRTARYGDNGAYVIESANSQSLVFYSDIDYDGNTEKVRYFLDGTTLKKGIIDPYGFPVTYPTNLEKIRIVAENVRNGALPLFYYYNKNWPKQAQGNPLQVPADQDSVSLIRLSLRINSKANSSQTDYILESFTQIRTVKDNL